MLEKTNVREFLIHLFGQPDPDPPIPWTLRSVSEGGTSGLVLCDPWCSWRYLDDAPLANVHSSVQSLVNDWLDHNGYLPVQIEFGNLAGGPCQWRKVPHASSCPWVVPGSLGEYLRSLTARPAYAEAAELRKEHKSHKALIADVYEPHAEFLRKEDLAKVRKERLATQPLLSRLFKSWEEAQAVWPDSDVDSWDDLKQEREVIEFLRSISDDEHRFTFHINTVPLITYQRFSKDGKQRLLATSAMGVRQDFMEALDRLRHVVGLPPVGRPQSPLTQPADLEFAFLRQRLEGILGPVGATDSEGKLPRWGWGLSRCINAVELQGAACHFGVRTVAEAQQIIGCWVKGLLEKAQQWRDESCQLIWETERLVLVRNEKNDVSLSQSSYEWPLTGGKLRGWLQDMDVKKTPLPAAVNPWARCYDFLVGAFGKPIPFDSRGEIVVGRLFKAVGTCGTEYRIYLANHPDALVSLSAEFLDFDLVRGFLSDQIYRVHQVRLDVDASGRVQTSGRSLGEHLRNLDAKAQKAWDTGRDVTDGFRDRLVERMREATKDYAAKHKPPRRADPYAEHRRQNEKVLAVVEGGKGIEASVRHDHMAQLKKEQDQRLVGTVGYYDGWDGLP